MWVFGVCMTFFSGLSASSFGENNSMLREEGYLDVSSLHSIYYACYGNKDGVPAIILHGGPGAGCSASMAESFDLTFWNVIMFDQRGANRSKPFGCMEENTTSHLINDIEALREHFGVDQWLVFGGSWGSALGMLYGQKHPDRCLGFVLRGVFLARDQDHRHLFYEMGKIFPEAYQKVIDLIPENEQEDLFEAYYKRLMNPDPKIHLETAKVFMEFDITCASHMPMPELVSAVVNHDKVSYGCAKTYAQYAKNHFFIEPNQILENLEQISNLPSIIVQGRYDAICLPYMAYLVHQSWQKSQLWMVPDGGHSALDPAISKHLFEATESFKAMFSRGAK